MMAVDVVDKSKIIDIFLKPGEFFWGDEQYRITTVLGSCISICAWHPEKKIGGICHYRFPGRRTKKRETVNLDYGDDSVFMLIDYIGKSGTRLEEYVVKLFGGSRMFKGESVDSIGARNAEAAVRRLGENGFSIHSSSIGEGYSRKIIFDIAHGDVWLKNTK
jgi:chemotaxis protein CheD